jgi:hypothetical protein
MRGTEPFAAQRLRPNHQVAPRRTTGLFVADRCRQINRSFNQQRIYQMAHLIIGCDESKLRDPAKEPHYWRCARATALAIGPRIPETKCSIRSACA